ncbi:hypothetical protein [Erwinia oleae]|uniref:hypothetical protein n=1 Tax=Erwinia oleae TaxID=796334 RepID=UPI001269E581|nr:hypothetical protein [Erwinia oleae]
MEKPPQCTLLTCPLEGHALASVRLTRFYREYGELQYAQTICSVKNAEQKEFSGLLNLQLRSVTGITSFRVIQRAFLLSSG